MIQSARTRDYFFTPNLPEIGMSGTLTGSKRRIDYIKVSGKYRREENRESVV
jgi:hypothetical protein